MTKFKVLFIHPNEYLRIGIPNGIATLSAVLKRHDFEVESFDFTFIKPEGYKVTLTANKGLYLPTEYTLEDLVASDPIRNLNHAFKEKLLQFKPDLVAVSTMTGHFDKVINLLETVKVECPVIVGGVHATLCSEDVLSNNVVDFICVGEGEELLVELCSTLQDGKKDYASIRNLGYKVGNALKINELRPFINLDEIPCPDWSLFDKRHLFRPFMGKVYQGSFYVMSRGCPQDCTYCVNDVLKRTLRNCGRYFRYQSPKTTISQISSLKSEFGADWFKFADDSIMLLSEEYLEELHDGLKELDIQFGCSVRPETTTIRKVELLKSMGCVAASVGIESGNENLRKSILNRRMSNQQIETAIQILKNAGIRVSTFNMIGLPGESRDNVFETIALNKKLNVEAVNFYIVYPYPGTAISEKYKTKYRNTNGIIVPVSQASSFALSAMPPQEVDALLRTVDLYIALPEKMWRIIRLAEGQDHTAQELRNALYEYNSSG